MSNILSSESLYRHMLKQFQEYHTALTCSMNVDIQQAVDHILQEFSREDYDALAIYKVLENLLLNC